MINHDDLKRMKKAKKGLNDQRRQRIGLWCSICGTILGVLGTAGWVVFVWFDW
jgi:hypothetical protein